LSTGLLVWRIDKPGGGDIGGARVIAFDDLPVTDSMNVRRDPFDYRRMTSRGAWKSENDAPPANGSTTVRCTGFGYAPSRNIAAGAESASPRGLDSRDHPLNRRTPEPRLSDHRRTHEPEHDYHQPTGSRVVLSDAFELANHRPQPLDQTELNGRHPIPRVDKQR
jgi:hypothetical protein